MYNFFNNTDTAQHHHDDDHGTAGSDVIPDDSNNSNAESTHDNEDRNHDQPEKESTDMNRIIKNSIAPVLAGFTVSVLFILGMASNAAGFTTNTLDRDNFNAVIATANLDADARDYDKAACSCKDDAQRDRLTDGDTFNGDGQDIARNNYDDLAGFRDTNVDDINDATLARFNVDLLNGDVARPDVESVNDVDNNQLANLDADNLDRFNEASLIRANDDKPVDLDSNDINASDNDGIARINADNPDSFNLDGFNRDGSDA